jgi:hypothetical protein
VHCLRKGRIKIRKQLLIGEMKDMGWDVEKVTLLEGTEEKEVCNGTLGGAALLRCQVVVGEVVDGMIMNINGPGEDVELGDGGAELEFAVGDGTTGIGAGDDSRGNIGGPTTAPDQW